MVMTQVLTIADLDHARNLLRSQGPSSMYDFLSAKGYKYATLANGVAKGNSVAGEVAINFMKLTAANMGAPMLPESIDAVRFEMAGAYIEKLLDKLRKNNGVLSSDIDHKEAWRFHTDVFKTNGL